jgi:hypothetical protein
MVGETIFVGNVKKAMRPGAGGQIHKDFYSTLDLKSLTPTSTRYMYNSRSATLVYSRTAWWERPYLLAA